MGIWINASGGSTKGAGIAGMLSTLLAVKKVVPVGMTGVSIGAALALPSLLGKHAIIKELITTITLKQVFDNIPVNDKGKITLKALQRMVCSLVSDKVGALGTQNNFIKLYREIVTEEDFEYYLTSDLAPIYVGIVNINIGEAEFINIKTVNYNRFLELIMASTSIPLATELVEIGNNKFYTDGGVAAHIGCKFVVDSHFKVTELINCFSRPKHLQVAEIIKTRKDIEIAKTAIQIFDIQSKNNSKLLEDFIALYSKHYNIKNTNLYTPYLLTHMYDMNSERLNLLYEAGVQEVLLNYN